MARSPRPFASTKSVYRPGRTGARRTRSGPLAVPVPPANRQRYDAASVSTPMPNRTRGGTRTSARARSMERILTLRLPGRLRPVAGAVDAHDLQRVHPAAQRLAVDDPEPVELPLDRREPGADALLAVDEEERVRRLAHPVAHA